MKKIKNIFFTFLLFNSIFAQNNIDFLELNPGSFNYQIFEKEINSLKNNNPNVDIISLDDERNKNLAPRFVNQIIQMVQRLVEVSKIKMPELNLYVGASEKTYNASATTSITKITTTKTVTKNGQINKSTKEEFEKDYKLTLGENLIKLFFWNKDGSDLLQSIIAHEIGHMYHLHTEESKQSEYQADAKAIALLGKNKGGNLINAIDMATLSGHIYNILRLLPS